MAADGADTGGTDDEPELEAISGVGEKTATALRELDDPEAALERGDVAALASAPGISAGRAARIARAAIRDRHGDPGGFLATEHAREIHERVLDLLRERTVTDYAARRVATFYPSGSASRVAEVREFASDALERDPAPEVLAALEEVSPLETPTEVRVRDRCLATSDAERYGEAREAVPELPAEVVEDARGIADLARGYSTVVALDEEFAGVDVGGDVRVEPNALENPAELVPERTLAFYATNRERIRGAAAVHRAAGVDPPADLSLSELEAALERLGPDGEVRGDDELARLNLNVDDLDAAVAFYSALFSTEPAKRRPGYANFALEEPALKLVLLENPGAGGTLNHLGVEVATTGEVVAATRRLAGQGLETTVEEGTTCCYALQDKVWVHGPDGEPWEVYTVLDELRGGATEGAGDEDGPAAAAQSCAAGPACCA